MKRVVGFVVMLWVVALVAAAWANAGTIYVRNLSTVYTTEQLQLDVVAIDHAFQSDFNPAWGTNTRLVYSPFPPARTQVIALINKDDNNPGALGYHDVALGAIPFGVVLAQTTLDNNVLVSEVLSHEAFEMSVDPLVNDVVQVHRYWFPFWVQETADPVESTRNDFTIDGIQVSDFVLPNWFRAGSPGPWDFTRHTIRPLQVLPGGYQLAWSRAKQDWVHLCAAGELCRSMSHLR